MASYSSIPTVVVATEGFTEKYFLDHLRQRDIGCSVIVMKSTNPSPHRILVFAKSQINERGLKLKYGDSVFCVFDRDFSTREELSKTMSQAAKAGIGIVFSKPCFEIVFLAHFTSDLQRFKTPEDVLEELEKYIPGYSKTRDYWDLLSPRRDEARGNLAGFSFGPDSDFDGLPNGSNVFELFDRVAGYRRR